MKILPAFLLLTEFSSQLHQHDSERIFSNTVYFTPEAIDRVVDCGALHQTHITGPEQTAGNLPKQEKIGVLCLTRSSELSWLLVSLIEQQLHKIKLYRRQGTIRSDLRQIRGKECVTPIDFSESGILKPTPPDATFTAHISADEIQLQRLSKRLTSNEPTWVNGLRKHS